MSLLKTLGLKVSKTRLAAVTDGAPPDTIEDEGRGAQVAAGDEPSVQSRVTVRNRTGSEMRLVAKRLKFRTARFVPAAPPLVPAFTDITFQVIESTVGADKTAGSLRYHLERRRNKVDFTFEWDRETSELTVHGDGPFARDNVAETDSNKGNVYSFQVTEFPTRDPLSILVNVENAAGFGMTLVSATLEDPEHTEFSRRPLVQIKNGKSDDFFVQPIDDEHPEGAGNVVYRIDRPGKPQLARLRWRRGGDAIGTLAPNDGSFEIKTRAFKDGFGFKVVKRNPLLPPPGPTQVTIVNNTGFALKLDSSRLDEPTAKFKTPPAATIDGGGRKARFEVVATDEEFPDTGGFVGYSFRTDPATDKERLHIVSMQWARAPKPSLTDVQPPADGVSSAISGSAADIVFTVTGPELDFNPPEKIKQPTLRLHDKSVDGWVEYLQEALNHHIKAGLVVDGDFGDNTHKAVIKFQEKHKKEGVMVDGVVGNQTWSFLREGVPEKPGTDGRKPHSFVEKGLEARWVREKEVCRFDAAQDALVMQAVSVGDTDKLQDRLVRIRVINPDGVKKILDRPLGPPVAASKTGQGSTHDVRLEQFATLFDEKASKAPPGSYTVDAFFDDELGGDKFSEVVVVPAS